MKDDHKILLMEIERYFDCALSDSEEALLRRRLAATDLADPAIDEARAVMGIRAPQVAVRRQVGRVRWRALAAVAACAAVVAAVGFGLTRLHNGGMDAGECFAYVNGVRVTDEDAVMRCVMDGLGDVAQCDRRISEAEAAEMVETFAIIDDYENEDFLLP